MPEPRVALVAGGSGGVGREVCASLAARGFTVAVGYRSRPQAAEEVVDALRNRGGAATAVHLDLGDREVVDAAVQSTLEQHRRIDAAVYAAGPYIPQRWLAQVTVEEMTRILIDDTVGCFTLAGAALPALREAKGSFVALSTPAVARHIKKDSLSSVPKAAVEAMVRAIATEEARFGVRANAVAVGFIEAGMFFELRERGDFDEAYVEAATLSVPLGYRGSAKDVAETVAFLASDSARYVTGQTVQVDGGLSL